MLAGMSAFFGVLPPLPTQTIYAYHGDVQNIASGMILGWAEGVIVADADHLGSFSP